MRTFLRYLMVTFMVMIMTGTSILADNSNLSGSAAEEHSIYFAEIAGCTFVCDATSFEAGDVVSFEVIIDDGYEFYGDVIIYDYEQHIELFTLNSYYSFIMQDFDVYIEAVVYRIPTAQTLTINYLNLDGTQAAAPYVGQVVAEQPFSVTSPVIAGFTADYPVVNGYMPWRSYTLNVYYYRNSYLLTINYQYEYGGNVYPPFMLELEYGDSYHFVPSPLAGYTCNPAVVEGTMPANDLTVNVQYIYNNPFYYIYIGRDDNGVVELDDYQAYEGDIITLYETPNDGYEFDHWQVLDANGVELEVFMDQFVMPASAVTVNAFFNPIANPMVLMHTGTVTTCYSEFYDTGGKTGAYSANEDYTLTFMPGVAGNMVKIAFNSFWIEKNYEHMYIYNGVNTSATLIGDFNDRQLASTEIVASNSDGALTIRFTSDRSVNRFGWNAVVTCIAASNFNITYVQPENGYVPADYESAKQGDLITLSCMPDAGYEVVGWVVMDDDDNQIAVDNNSFVMPASNVTVSAVLEYVLYVDHYELVTSTSELVNGETYIIVADVDGMKLAMGAQDYVTSGVTTNYYRDYVLVELMDDVIPVTPGVVEFTLNKSGNRYSFYDMVEDGYLYTNRSLAMTGGRVSYIYSLATTRTTSYKYWSINLGNNGASTIRNTSFTKDMGLDSDGFNVFALNANAKVYLYKKVTRNNSRGGVTAFETEEPAIQMFEEGAPVDVTSLVYPNPTSGKVTIEARNMKQISVFNVMGQLVYETQESAEKFDLDLSNYVTGMAILRIVTEDGITTQRVIVK